MTKEGPAKPTSADTTNVYITHDREGVGADFENTAGGSGPVVVQSQNEGSARGFFKRK
jgi:hypothetical protein